MSRSSSIRLAQQKIVQAASQRLCHHCRGGEIIFDPAARPQADFDNFFDSIPDLACVVLPNGHFKRLNSSWERSLGFTRETMLKTPMLNLIHPDDSGRTLSEVARQGPLYRTKSFVNRYRCRDGSYRTFDWSTTFNSDESTRFGIARDITEQEITEKAARAKTLQLAHDAHHDHLTGLANRRCLNEWLSREIDNSHQSHASFSVLLLDLDGFKHINDSLGHLIGDKLLQSISDRIVAYMNGCGIVARLGGDEFVVVPKEMESYKSIGWIAERLSHVLVERHSIDGHHLYVTASIGVSTYPQDGLTPENLIRSADMAMYRAKKDVRQNRLAYSV